MLVHNIYAGLKSYHPPRPKCDMKISQSFRSGGVQFIILRKILILRSDDEREQCFEIAMDVLLFTENVIIVSIYKISEITKT